MLIVVSPAKKLDMTPVENIEPTAPDFAGETSELTSLAAHLSVADLRRLMKISEQLARINADRYAKFDSLPEKPAVFSFAGDTYQGLDVASLDPDALQWAQSHLRILSGLYGLLRPLDAVRPYRLEMGSRLQNPHGKNLYAFWGDKIAQALNAQARATKTDVLVNCASKEYFDAVDRKTLNLKVITPVFYEKKDGTHKIVSFYAKRARGAMARYIIERRLRDPEGLKDFDSGGYRCQ